MALKIRKACNKSRLSNHSISKKNYFESEELTNVDRRLTLRAAVCNLIAPLAAALPILLVYVLSNS